MNIFPVHPYSFWRRTICPACGLDCRVNSHIHCSSVQPSACPLASRDALVVLAVTRVLVFAARSCLRRNPPCLPFRQPLSAFPLWCRGPVWHPVRNVAGLMLDWTYGNLTSGYEPHQATASVAAGDDEPNDQDMDGAFQMPSCNQEIKWKARAVESGAQPCNMLSILDWWVSWRWPCLKCS